MSSVPRHLCVRLDSARQAIATNPDGATQAIAPDAHTDLLALLQELAPLSPPDAAETLRSLQAFEHALGSRSPSERDVAQIHLLLGNLYHQLCPEDWAGEDGEDLGSLVPDIAPSISNPHQRVALYVESPAIAQLLSAVLREGGFQPFPIRAMAQLLEGGEGEDRQPAAIVADLSLCRRDVDTRAVVRQLREQVVPAPHLFCLAANDDFDARLEAVRLGATRFLKKPLDTDKLLAVLRGVTDREPVEAYRVLLVDDDLATTLLNAVALTDIRMEVRAVNEPAEALAVVEEFRPDVIVMDVYMPGCNGLELASILRQDEDMADTPILFLSAESNIHRQLLAMDLGADDFLTKPVEEELLQASVVARAKRARMLRRTRLESRAMARKLDSLLSPASSSLQPWRLDVTRRLLLAPTGAGAPLSALETALLQALALEPEYRAGRERLIAALTDTPGPCDGSRLEALISRLRRKTAEKCGMKLPIRSEYGRGYSFGGRLAIL